MRSNIKIIAVFFSAFVVFSVKAQTVAALSGEKTNISNIDAKQIEIKTAWVNKQVIISWENSMGVNASRYDVQRSFNDKDYELVESVTVGANAKKAASYAITDTKNKNRRGQSYYRLRTVLVNGQEFFTESVKAKKPGVFNNSQGHQDAASVSGANNGNPTDRNDIADLDN